MRRRALALGIAALAVCSLMTFAGPSGAHAEACTKGQPPRTLATDDSSAIEVQSCLSGEWVSVGTVNAAPDTLTINETVQDPKESKYGINVSDFFDLKKIDPYAIITAFKNVASGVVTLTDAEKLKEKKDLAQQKAQALLNRQDTRAKDACRTRSVAYSALKLLAGGQAGWLPPASTAPAGQPSQITYAFAADVPDDVKATILNAISQYPDAVRYEDAAALYPEQIVPHDPSDSRAPTITFTANAVDDDTAAETFIGESSGSRLSGGQRWVSGRVNIVPGKDTPMAVGHEIGHVLGLDHGSDLDSTMFAVLPTNGHAGSPWTPTGDMEGPEDQAFSACMFLPPVTPTL